MNKFDEITKEIEKRYQKVRKSHDWEHTQRVYNLCMKIGEKESADLEILKLAAVLHDIGREEQDNSNGKLCHAQRGAVLARKILEKYNLPQEQINKIIHCIETHRFRGDKIPCSKEAKILYDADKLDAIGAIGIGRTFAYHGAHKSPMWIPELSLDSSEYSEHSNEPSTVHHFYSKLLKLRNNMNTETARKMADERHKFMELFLQEFFDEWNGKK